MRDSQTNRGFTLLEAMIAAVILTVALVGFMSTVCSCVVVDDVTQENNLALDVGRQVLEQIKGGPFETLRQRAGVAGSTEAPTTTWYGTTLGGTQDSVEIDANGNFSIAGLQPVNGDADGKVGNVRIEAVEVDGSRAFDLAEIVVTIQWVGRRGEARQILREQVVDWGG